MDGASSLRIWWQIIMPLSGPALAALVIFVSLNSWNEFLWPLIITNSLESGALVCAHQLLKLGADDRSGDGDRQQLLIERH
jgi:ABC-type glycerol-3-phosphate transport system permease component